MNWCPKYCASAKAENEKAFKAFYADPKDIYRKNLANKRQAGPFNPNRNQQKKDSVNDIGDLQDFFGDGNQNNNFPGQNNRLLSGTLLNPLMQPYAKIPMNDQRKDQNNDLMDMDAPGSDKNQNQNPNRNSAQKGQSNLVMDNLFTKEDELYELQRKLFNFLLFLAEQKYIDTLRNLHAQVAKSFNVQFLEERFPEYIE
ncbi:MAG: hypothetical protein MJ252_20090 [archaeon]|nr:hypothetical protein [archaeon]